ncbi:hypothetical protein AH01_24 [Pantoea phage AH01]|nr:hypothetical protein AH01_24 [Pantoea phage AH01]
MNPVTIKTMPTKGQFVAVYPGTDGTTYAATLKWIDGNLSAYNGFQDEWVNCWYHGYSPAFLESVSATYILL